MRSLVLALLVLGACSCGGKPPAGDATRELDQRHCTNNSDCISGFCSSSGRCG